MTKSELRKQYKLLREEINNRLDKSSIITKKILEDSNYKKAKRVGIYNSFGSEVDTKELIRISLLDKEVGLPVVIGKDMIFSKIDDNTEYSHRDFGMLEPTNINVMNDIDLLIVPGICFDKEKNRLGFGGGYYDRYLNNHNIETIGICFEEQISNEPIPVEEHDVKVKKIITDKSIY